MNKQITLSALTDELAKAKTRKDEFLTQMEGLIPDVGQSPILSAQRV